MRIESLQLHNFGSFRSARFAFDAPITLVYSPNNAGKSTLCDALAWCLTGLCRGTDRRGAGIESVISDGADTMKVAVSLRPRTDDPATIDVVRGVKDRSALLQINGGAGRLADQQAKLGQILGYSDTIVSALLNSRAFLDLAHADAKAILLTILDVRVPIDGEALTLGQIDARYQAAFEQRKVAKAQLQAVRVPDAPVDDAPDLVALEEQLQTLRDEEKLRLAAVAKDHGRREQLEREHADAGNDLHRLEQAIDKTADLADQIASIDERLAMLEPTAGDEPVLQAHRTKLAAADGRLPMLERTLLSIRTHDPKKGCVLDGEIPCQTAAKHFGGQVARLEQEVQTLKADKDAATEALQAQRSLAGERSRLEADLRSLRDRHQARETLRAQHRERQQQRDRLLEQLDALPEAAALDPDLATLQHRIRRGESTIIDARGVVDAWRRHQEAKDKQAVLAKEVATLEQRVEQLGPKGARIDALAAAVSVFEAAINGALERFGYTLAFQLDPWDVRVNGRSAVRLSESERLRVGLCLQLALADVTGLGLVVIDGADLLDARNRGALVEVLGSWEGQAIVTATRDEPPPAMDDVAVYWLTTDHGVTHVERIAASMEVA